MAEIPTLLGGDIGATKLWWVRSNTNNLISNNDIHFKKRKL